MRRNRFLVTGLMVSALCAVSHSFAQVSTNGLVDWFDADSGVATNGFGEVTGWTNQGTGNNVTVGDPDAIVIAGPNGQDMISFLNLSGGVADDGLKFDASVGFETGYTAFVAVRLVDDIANGNSFPRLLRTDNDAQAVFIRRDADPVAQIEIKSNPVGSGDRLKFDYSPTFAVGDLAIITAVVTPSQRRLFFNGIQVDSSDAGVGPIAALSTDTWEIGNAVVGDIGSVLLYSSAAGLNDWNDTGAQLAADYGVAWTNIEDVPTLLVNRDTGEMTFTNNAASSLDIVGYSITSIAGSLDPVNWKSITDNYDVDGPNSANGGALIGSVDGTNSWSETTSSTTELTEAEPLASGATLVNGQSFDLGVAGAWAQSRFEDVQMVVELTGGGMQGISIQYVGNGGSAFGIGDMNFSGGDVDAADWAIYNAGRGVDLSGLSLADAYRMGDLDGDLDNDLADFLLFKEAFEAVNGAGSLAGISAIPEPSTFVLIGIGLCTLPLLRFRRLLMKTSTVAAVCCFALFTLAGTAQAVIVTNGLVDWFDADTGVTTAGGGDVTGWTNQGTGNDVNVGDLESSVVAGPNGQTMIRFNNLETTPDDAGLRYGASVDLESGYTAFIVMRLNDAIANGSNFPRMLRTTNDAQAVFIRQSDEQVEMKVNPHGRPQFDYSPTYAVGDGVGGVGDIAIITAFVTPSERVLYFNGVEVSRNSGGSADIDAQSGDIWEIGNRVQGDIGTVLLYNHTTPLGLLTVSGQQLADDYNVDWTDLAAPINQGLLTLRINRNSGAMTIENTSGENVSIDSYEITSASGSLDSVAWLSLQEQGFDGGDMIPNNGIGWDEAGGVGEGQLIESRLAGSSDFLDGAAPVSLGDGYDFNKVGAAEDLVFAYHLAGTPAFLASGGVEFFDGPSDGLEGDFNDDGFVNAADYTVWRDNLGAADETALNGNGNGIDGVDAADYTLWKTNLGSSAGSGSVLAGNTSVPEPSAVVLLLMGILGLGSTLRRRA